MRVADVLLGLAGTKQHEVFDGIYAIRSIPPRPACGERIEVRGHPHFSEDALTVGINRRGSRSTTAKEGDAA